MMSLVSESERDGLLVVGAVNPEAAVLRLDR
jgi:hypothetical protein